MSFDIVQTPTLQAVSSPDEKLVADDLHKGLKQALGQAEAQAEVVAALEAQRVAEDHLKRLQKAERVLNEFAKQASEKMAARAQNALNAIIESAASGGKLDFSELSGLTAIESQNRLAAQAIRRIVENLIPVSEITRLREESHALMTNARALEQIAQDRAEKVLGRLRAAVTDEVVLPIDMSKGVAGAILAHASGLKRCALQISGNADQIERSFTERRAGDQR